MNTMKKNMRRSKKMKLRKWVKVVLTILVILVSFKIYAEMGQIRTKAVSSINYQVIAVLGWTWLLMGQIWVYSIIWERKEVI